MTRRSAILDTNVLVAGLRSRRGASHQLLHLIGREVFDVSVSVPLLLEYEAVLLRELAALLLSAEDIGDFLDYLCAAANRQAIFFLWRPRLPDPKDDMVLELAVAAGSDTIVTFNVRHFSGAKEFGLKVMTPGEFLHEIKVQT